MGLARVQGLEHRIGLCLNLIDCEFAAAVQHERHLWVYAHGTAFGPKHQRMPLFRCKRRRGQQVKPHKHRNQNTAQVCPRAGKG